MSTKTLRKRIALVAVSAMGFGLLTVTPSANAAIFATGGGVVADNAAAISSVTVAPVRIGDSQNVTVKLSYGTTADTYTVGNDTANAGAVVRARVLTGPTAGAIGMAVETSALVTTFANTQATGSTTVASISPTVAINPSVAGTYTLLVWVDESNTGGSNNSFPEVADLQTTVSFTTAGTPATVTLAASKSGKAGATTPGVFAFTLKDAAGNLTYLKSSLGETLAGSVSDVSVNATSGTLFVADGTQTDLTSGTATTKNILTAAATGTGAISVATSAAGIAQVKIVGSGTLTGVVPAVTADYTTVAYGFATKFELSTTTGVMSTATGFVKPAAIAAQTAAGTGTIYASNASALSLSFKVTTGSTPSTVQYTIAARTGVTLPAGVVAGTYTAATTGDSATATIAIAATSATAASGYDVSVAFDAATTMKYSVTYAAPSVSDTNGYVTLSPTTANAAKTLIGGSVTVTATVRDQFGAVFSGANVIWTVTGRNASTSAAVSNASGVSTLTIADASVSTTALTDTVVATAAAPTATAYTVSTNNSSSAVTSFAYVASMTVGTLTLTNSQASATAFAAGTDTAALLDESDTLTATATNAAGALMSGIPVTFTLPAGAYVAAGTLLTVYTNASGVAVLTGVKGTITGTNTATATAGGATGTTNWTVANSTTDGRVITIDNATMTVSGSSAGQAIVTVKDRYGNLVGGAAFSITYIGNAGRVAAVNGVITGTGTTGATTGTGRIDVTAGSTEAGTGTLTVSLTSPDASTATTMGNAAAYTTAVAKVSSVVTVGGVKSAELTALEAITAKAASDKAETDAKIKLLEAQIAAAQAASVAAAEAAADAAAEAIDAGNNAYDSANAATDAADAATAAAQQAGEDAVAAAEAAGAAAVEAAQSAQDAAAEATDAATAATDAANAAAEAADAATAAAQDAADAVAALSVQVTEVVASLKKQITALTNLVIRIQKKVKA